MARFSWPTTSRRALLVAGCVLAGLIGLNAQGPAGPAPGGQAGQAGRGGPGGQRGAGGAGPRGNGQNPPRDNQAPALPAGTATIAGTVTLAGGPTPVRHAQVTLNGGGVGRGNMRSTSTNDQGRFSFVALPAGRFTMNVSKPGFVTLAYGAKAPGRPGTPIQLANGQSLNDLKVSLPKGSVITGLVIDEFGEPAPNTPVRTFRYASQNGQKTLQSSGQATTDDRGIYRIFQLMPGDYLVSAAPRNTRIGDIQQQIQAQIDPLLQQIQAGGGLNAALVAGRGNQPILDQIQQLQQELAQQPEQPVAYAPVYYPGVVAPAQATKLTLAVGEERAGVDFQLQLVPSAKVQGHVTSPDGAIPPGTQVTMQLAGQPDLPSVPGVGTSMTRVEQDGSFNFQSVSPGQYTVSVRAPIRQIDPNAAQDGQANAGRGRAAGGFGPGPGRGGPGGPITQVLWASADVAVEGRDVSDIALNLQPGMTVSGRVAFDATTAPALADLTTVRVNLRPLDGQQLLGVNGAQADANGNFAITGIPPGRYAVTGNVSSNQGRATGPGGLPTFVPNTTATATASWSLKSAIVNGVDTLDFPFEVKPNDSPAGVLVTFSDRTQELSGTLQDSAGHPTSDYTIVLFAADSRYWTPQSRRIQSTRPGTDGTFSFRGFPAGQYRLTAVTDADPGEWYDPAFLAQVVPASMAITIAVGDKHTQDIRLAGQ